MRFGMIATMMCLLFAFVIAYVFINMTTAINEQNGTESFLSKLRRVEDIQDNVNSKFDALYTTENKNNDRKPFVCTFCDEVIYGLEDVHLVNPSKFNKIREKVKWSSLKDSERVRDYEKAYQFNANDVMQMYKHQLPSTKGCALSPRGSFVRNNTHKNARPGFTACRECQSAIAKNNLPFYAIRNKNFVGHPPKCLTDLTEIERAIISPVIGCGYTFTYTGGRQHQLKGTMSFMRLGVKKVANAVLQLDTLGLNKHVLVLLHGPFTAGQKARLKEKTTVRSEKLIEAIKWLCANHVKWQEVDANDIIAELKNAQPILVDKSKEVESENANIEEQELFACYYPDATCTAANGGFDDPAQFKETVEEMAKEGYEMEFDMRLKREYVTGNDLVHLVDASLMQFPYGVGGPKEQRLDSDGSSTDTVELNGYLQHLSRLSQPVFQQSLFQLVMYSIISKDRLMRTARLQVKNQISAANLAQGVDVVDFQNVLQGRRHGNYHTGSSTARTLLKSVQACARDLPHTNEAATRARSNAEALQHHFGAGSLFLTVTPDDNNSLIIQVLSGDIIDKDTEDVVDMSDAELEKRNIDRVQLRIDLPGFASMNFDMMMKIVLKEVVGWDPDNDCPTDKPGFFGICEAVSMAIEEQGRKTLHAHMIVWIRGYSEIRHGTFFAKTMYERRANEKALTKFFDHAATTECFSDPDKTIFRSCFEHECKVPARKRKKPIIVSDQELRYLRHRLYYKETDAAFARCPDCDYAWTYEDLLGSYLSNGHGLVEKNGLGDGFETIPVDRMRAHLIEYQKWSRDEMSVHVPVKTMVQATYQHHVSSHTTSCFKCSKKKGSKKRTHNCGECECRYRMPDRKRQRTCIDVVNEGLNWYCWDGEVKEQPIVQILPRRLNYDCFQNISCPAISESKLTCNSNMQLLTDGPIAQYQFKYITKHTQHQDTAEYAEVQDAIKGLAAGDRKWADDKKEAIRIICRAAFAHHKTNVISPPMASYLVRHGERFYFSHKFVFCPLDDLMKLERNQNVSATVRFVSKDETFFENHALHYLCRPKEYESWGPKRFFEILQPANIPAKSIGDDDTNIAPFLSDTGFFQHPSTVRRGVNKGHTRQGVKEREIKAHIKVPQWKFPDTAKFEGNIFLCPEEQINGHMEDYACIVLTLFSPHRSLHDLVPENYEGNWPFVAKFREWKDKDNDARAAGCKPIVFTEENMTFLQNIQNAAYNSLRYKVESDDLQKNTKSYIPEACQDDCDSSDDESEDSSQPAPTKTDSYEAFRDLLDETQVTNAGDDDPTRLHETLKGFTLKKIRMKGKRQCGTDLKIKPPCASNTHSNTWIREPPSAAQTHHNTNEEIIKERKEYNVREITQVLFRRNSKSVRKGIFNNDNVKVSEATGTARSIGDWAKAAELDRRQRRAFEVIISSFLLTFYCDKDNVSEEVTNRERLRYQKAKKSLFRLKGSTERQLKLLLHGPGGSGKSHVINLVQAYAKEYCALLGHPYTSRTIVITAMSGVAATLLHGETAHNALGLNRKRIKESEQDEWSDTRLLIVDEISFAGAGTIDKMERHICDLMRERWASYGNLNIVFAGDYSQLEPVRATTVYKDGQVTPAFQGSLNAFIELDGMHRFKDDLEWGMTMRRFREGMPTLADIQAINKECYYKNKDIPDSVQVATYYNKDRDAINSAIFEEYCDAHGNQNDRIFKGACVIFMDDLQMENEAKVLTAVKSNAVKKHFYQNCSEDACNCDDGDFLQGGRVDPVLKLYPDCPMMLTANKDVPNGQANGSRVRVVSVNTRRGEKPFKLQLASGVVIPAYYATQIDSITVRHEAKDIRPPTFNIKMSTFRFSTNLNVADEEFKCKMAGNQFPLISNSATTGHKLQGCTVNFIFVNDWHYSKNWPYVVLSRVRTKNGLVISQMLSEKLEKYEMDPFKDEMLQDLQSRLGLEDIVDYGDIYNDSETE